MTLKSRLFPLRPALFAAAFMVPAVTMSLAPPAMAEIEFRHALDNSPLDLAPIKGEEITAAVEAFRKDGVNPYNGDADAIAAGKTLYNDNCQACHKPDGSGGMGPSLIDDVYINKRANTDVGVFEIIHSGSSGAMRSFSIRGVTQDQILKMIAYIHTLKK
ncbi:hypothetical protein W911_12905 [Hyphomicrobium nitrativorans NL23]|uniref:Cytochrome c domain-containing protein n=1 Tax=Hyphomicrobium nitrativorans NL23 TaxID=1029756 RepID=V5SHB4_9HYPH|nr:c-type cytochrome [Hyphomicrobium nitrativorans]AHB50276.1 hypothetical protein W911_12905 [Hyphomicrobium nitrativorans NL23]